MWTRDRSRGAVTLIVLDRPLPQQYGRSRTYSLCQNIGFLCSEHRKYWWPIFVFYISLDFCDTCSWPHSIPKQRIKTLQTHNHWLSFLCWYVSFFVAYFKCFLLFVSGDLHFSYLTVSDGTGTEDTDDEYQCRVLVGDLTQEVVASRHQLVVIADGAGEEQPYQLVYPLMTKEKKVACIEGTQCKVTCIFSGR